MVFDPDKRKHKIETAGFRIDGDYSHAIPAHPEYYSDTDFDDAFYQERRDECNRLVGLPVMPIIYPGEVTLPQPPPGSVAVALVYDKLTGGGNSALQIEGVSKFFWLEIDGSYEEDPAKVGNINVPHDETSQHDGFAVWGEDPTVFKFISSGSWKYNSEFLPWTNTTNYTNYDKAFGQGMQGEIAELAYIDTTNWTDFKRLFGSSYVSKTDWEGALGWNTSNVTRVNNMWIAPDSELPDLSAWDWTAVEESAAMFAYASRFPRFLEKIQWGPNLTNLSTWGYGTSLYSDADVVKDGGGPLDLSGWDVRNIPTRPSSFLVPKDGGSFDNVIYPNWGTDGT